MRPTCLSVPAAILTCLSLGAVDAHATIVAEETFSYPSGDDVRGKNGGTGWAGPWTGVASGANGSFVVGALAGEPAGVTASGSALLLDGKSSATRIFRALDLGASSVAKTSGLVATVTTVFGTADELGKPGTTLWLGFIARGASGSVSAGTHLFEGVGSGQDACNNGWTHTFTESDKLGENIFIGRGNGNPNYGYERTCGHGSGCTSAHSVNLCNGNDYQSGIGFSTGVVHWVVVRMDFGSALGTSDATAATLTMWVDPTPASTDPDVTTGTPLFEVGVSHTPANRAQWVVSQFYFNTVELQSVTAGAAFDEYRLGTTFADVAYGSGPPPDMFGAPPPDLSTATGDLSTANADLSTATGDLSTADFAGAPPGSDLAAADLGTPLPASKGGCGCQAAHGNPAFDLGLIALALAFVLRRRA